MNPIGIIHTPYQQLQEMPVQPMGARDTVATVTLNAEYLPGLKDLDGFSHIYLIYQFHRSEGFELTVTPFLDTSPRGLFATRAPKRPNAIGLSLVELLAVEKNILRVRGADVLDATPLLDIKPYIEAFDHVRNTRSGWMDASPEQVRKMRSDNRFHN